MKPLFREVKLRLPLHTAFSCFLEGSNPVLLDSSMTHSHLGRFSYFSADPFLVVRSKGRDIELVRGENTTVVEGNPFDVLQELLKQYPMETVPELPPFQGGAVGYLAYDLGRHLEVLPSTAEDDLALPDLYLGFYDWVVAHDHFQDRAWLIVNPLPDSTLQEADKKLEALLGKLNSLSEDTRPLLPTRNGHSLSPESNFTHDDYIKAIQTAKEYISAGDIYQVNLSQRYGVALDVSPWVLYSHLREVNPVPYGAYLGFEDAQIVSASPELFLRVEGRAVETRPIKGTRPRGKSPECDRELAEELMASVKDRAENLMIVDLLRNDLGRACRIGSIRVPELFALESYATVHHMVSVVTGELADGLDLVDLLRATFPGGSVTGCPKIRAMEIIDELEPNQRSVYCGSIGFLGFNGNMDTSIVIRTVIVRDGKAYFQVGGAIVADSDPEGEFVETLDKARGTVLALERI